MPCEYIWRLILLFTSRTSNSGQSATSPVWYVEALTCSINGHIQDTYIRIIIIVNKSPEKKNKTISVSPEVRWFLLKMYSKSLKRGHLCIVLFILIKSSNFLKQLVTAAFRKHDLKVQFVGFRSIEQWGCRWRRKTLKGPKKLQPVFERLV